MGNCRGECNLLSWVARCSSLCPSTRQAVTELLKQPALSMSLPQWHSRPAARPLEEAHRPVSSCTCWSRLIFHPYPYGHNYRSAGRFSVFFRAVGVREWTASALSRLGHRLAHSRGKKAPASSESKQQASSKQAKLTKKGSANRACCGRICAHSGPWNAAGFRVGK
jgi:hypothetical protein